jgi:methionyl-tRNA formyltransferase
MRVIFMGSPDFAVPTLDALVEAGHEVAAVYCQPPRPAGRGKALQPTPVQRRAEEIGLAVRTPLSLRSPEEQAAFAAFGAEIAVVAAYGLILPQPVLEAPRCGCLNVHASLLPRWRGAAPIQRAILAGDECTGVTIMQMEAGLDTGPMLTCEEVSIDRKNAGQLADELAKIGARLMVDVLSDLGAYPHFPQPEEGVTYAAKVRKEEARLDFKQDAETLERWVRTFNPSPGAFFEFKGERIRILEAEIEDGLGPAGLVIDDRLTIACDAGYLRPLKVQRAGRAAMAPQELVRGFPVPAGTTLA